jgi:DNA-binding PadR family transcriptional regulator
MKIPTVNETISPQVFYILLALTDKTLHGYGIRDQVAHDSRGSVVMAPGTVYILLKRMLVKGWVKRLDAGDSAKITARYELTRSGNIKFEGEAARMREVAEHVRYKLTGQIRFER